MKKVLRLKFPTGLNEANLPTSLINVAFLFRPLPGHFPVISLAKKPLYSVLFRGREVERTV